MTTAATAPAAPASSREPWTGSPLRVLVATSADPAQDEQLPGDEARVLALAAGAQRLDTLVVRVGAGGGGVRAARRVRSALRAADPDVVLATGRAAAAAAVPAAVLTGHRVVRVRHAHEDPLPGWLERRCTVVTPASSSGADAAHRLAGALAEVVARPGAGIDPAQAPPMSLVVPVWREGALVDDLVAALLPQLRADDELILVDDGSPDDTGERVERAAAEHPQVRAVRQPRNAGAAAARNAGVAIARHPRVVFTDAGCHWGASWLDGMRTPFAEPAPPDLVAGAHEVSRRGVLEAAFAVGCYPDPRELRRVGPLTAAWSRCFGRRFDPTRPAGRSIAVTTAAMERVGGWPEEVRAHEDLDLSRAIAEAGLKCVATTDAPLVWDQADARGMARMYVRYGRGDAEATDRQALARDAVRAAAYVVGPLALALGGRTARALVLAGAAVYVAVPVARAGAEERPVATAALVPVVVALRDLAKAWGALRAVLERRGGRRPS
ncbi:glycosyltransferase [Kineococcus indalonis]|uniref:glycosyltransferase n=1 Tax=Kineococcus indalonis TaxID=2696566 RepID=UPI001411ED20|nr:glycosyltransferase family 2 protein [Kineococcus indalonis]NAZ87566.1 glycosyltransferase [Kineococcus indalonis]